MRRCWSICRGVVFGLLLLAASSSVQGQSRPASPVSTEEQLRSAIDLHNQGRFDEAAQLLARALTEAERPALRARLFLELGINHAILGQTDLARSSFVSALTLDPALEIDAEVVKPEVVALFREERSRLRAVLRVTATEPGAGVSLDGQRVGTCPLELRAPIGAHLVEVWDGEGRRLLHQRVLLRPGQAVRVQARSVEGPRPKRSPDSRAATVPATSARPAARLPSQAERRSPRRVWAWVTAGGALAAAGAGLGLWRHGVAGYDEYLTTSDPKRYDELTESVPRRYVAADILFGVSAALAVTSAVLFLVDARSRGLDERPAPRVSATLTGLGASLQGRF